MPSQKLRHVQKSAPGLVVGHVMVLYLSDRTNIGFSFIFLTVNLFRHATLIEHGLFWSILTSDGSKVRRFEFTARERRNR